MKRMNLLLLMVLLSALVAVSCGPAAEENPAEEAESEEAVDEAAQGEEHAEYQLPRELHEYRLGGTFEAGDDFQHDENAAIYAFNGVEGETYVKEADAEAGNSEPSYTVRVINGRIFSVTEKKSMDFAEADSMLARNLTMYGNMLDRENRPASENDMHWINFSTEKTALRVEWFNGTFTTTISAYDLLP